jgi:hypothetical protein
MPEALQYGIIPLSVNVLQLWLVMTPLVAVELVVISMFLHT